MKVTVRTGKKEKSGWLVAVIKFELREVSFWVPRRDMRREESYF